MVLSMLLGITSSVCSIFLRFGCCILRTVLNSNPIVSISMPTAQETPQYRDSISEKYSLLEDLYAMADGIKIYLQESSKEVRQNMFYNGWEHDHYVGNVLVFVPSGVVIAAAFNAPGCMLGDGGVGQRVSEAGKVYENHGATCVVDSAFRKGDYYFLIKSEHDMPLSSDRNTHIKERQATSVRQASEWGMSEFKGSFPRFKDRLFTKSVARGRLFFILQFYFSTHGLDF